MEEYRYEIEYVKGIENIKIPFGKIGEPSLGKNPTEPSTSEQEDQQQNLYEEPHTHHRKSQN